jgi:hypothetical protein
LWLYSTGNKFLQSILLSYMFKLELLKFKEKISKFL